MKNTGNHHVSCRPPTGKQDYISSRDEFNPWQHGSQNARFDTPQSTDGHSLVDVAAIDIDEGLVMGTTAVISIRNIAAIETRQLSWIKTGLLLGVGALTLATADTDEFGKCSH